MVVERGGQQGLGQGSKKVCAPPWTTGLVLPTGTSATPSRPTFKNNSVSEFGELGGRELPLQGSTLAGAKPACSLELETPCRFPRDSAT